MELSVGHIDKLRVARQYVDSLGTGSGKLRTTRQYVDVVGPGENGKIQVTRQFIPVQADLEQISLMHRRLMAFIYYVFPTQVRL
jgi:hypothetical protein